MALVAACLYMWIDLVRQLIRTGDGELSRKDLSRSVLIVRLATTDGQFVLAGLYRTDTVCIHLRELAGMELEGDRLGLPRKQSHMLKAFQLKVRR